MQTAGIVNAKRSGKINILLDNSNESLYWIRFILADEHIYNKLGVC